MSGTHPSTDSSDPEQESGDRDRDSDKQITVGVDGDSFPVVDVLTGRGFTARCCKGCGDLPDAVVWDEITGPQREYREGGKVDAVEPVNGGCPRVLMRTFSPAAKTNSHPAQMSPNQSMRVTMIISGPAIFSS